jgi:hypothetical protein
MKFNSTDIYWFRSGVVLLAGLFLIPVIYGRMASVAFGWAIIPSLISCGVFLYSIDEQGQIQPGKMFFALGIVFLLALRASAPGSGRPFFIAGGMLGFLLMYGCGYIGMVTGRQLEARNIVVWTRGNLMPAFIIVGLAALVALLAAFLIHKNHEKTLERLREELRAQEANAIEKRDHIKYGTPERPYLSEPSQKQ